MNSFNSLWLTETIRLTEHHQGAMDDSAYIHALRHQALSPQEKLQQRAQYLADEHGLVAAQQRLRRYAKYSLVLLLLLAISTGISLAYAALGSQGTQVNVLSAWIALLGLNTVSMVLWCVFILVPRRETTETMDAPWLGRLWLGLSQRLSQGVGLGIRGANPELGRTGDGVRRVSDKLSRAGYGSNRLVDGLISLTRRQRLSAWLFSTVSHALWLVILLTAGLMLLFLLSTQRYTFVWETTILSAETLETIAYGLGYLPSLVGFSTPDVTQLMTPDATHHSTLHAQWSTWLLGQWLVYGLLPRSLALALCGGLSHWRLKRVRLDLQYPDYVRLLARLEPVAESTGVDALASEPPAPTFKAAPLALTAHSTLMVGIELNPRAPWPPPEVQSLLTDTAEPLAPESAALAHSTKLIDGGNLDDRAQRHALIEQLAPFSSQGQALRHILFLCDAQQTPDRGQLNLMHQLASYAQHAVVLLINLAEDAADQRSLWFDALSAAGLEQQQLCLDAHAVQAQLKKT